MSLAARFAPSVGMLLAALVGCNQPQAAPAARAAAKGAPSKPAIQPDAVPRVSPAEAHRMVQAGRALLVCAYEDEARCRSLQLEGSMSLRSLESQRPALDQEIIFYCA